MQDVHHASAGQQEGALRQIWRKRFRAAQELRVSVAGTLLLTEATMTELPEEKPAPTAAVLEVRSLEGGAWQSQTNRTAPRPAGARPRAG
jgi:hypothetical protein